MDKRPQMELIEKNVKVCQECRLYKTAKCGVPGEGDINAEIVLIGEAPGATEDATGRPFVGRAGKLLEALLKEIGYTRDSVWIGNIIKHRPPENRDPLPDEIAACEPYITEQLRIINPKLVVTLGRFSLNYFYPEGKISRDHGRMIDMGKYRVFPVYHPAAALRNSAMAKALREDFLKIPNVLLEARSKFSESKSSVEDFDNKDQTGLGL